jgi:hypothetical protein
MIAREPERVARTLVEKKWTDREDYARQTLRDLPYGRWREFNPEDTMRFYALRLHEAGMVKASPQKILAQGADWRFLNELASGSRARWERARRSLSPCRGSQGARVKAPTRRAFEVGEEDGDLLAHILEG